MGVVATIGRCLAVAIVVAGSMYWTANDVILRASTPPAFVLNLRLTTTQTLPPISAAALIAEANAIWSDAHVQLRWLNAEPDQRDGDGDPPRFLRVVVMARVVQPAGQQAPWAVGELVRMEGARALAIASVTGARRVIAEAARLQRPDLQAVHEQRLGVVLGRAVAHEIGHYLLQTDTHSTRGLMRASIGAQEFADLRSGTFRLDEAAQAHMSALAAHGLRPVDSTSAAFSYATR